MHLAVWVGARPAIRAHTSVAWRVGKRRVGLRLVRPQKLSGEGRTQRVRFWRRGWILACGGAWSLGDAPLDAVGAASLGNALASNALIDRMLARAAVLRRERCNRVRM